MKSIRCPPIMRPEQNHRGLYAPLGTLPKSIQFEELLEFASEPLTVTITMFAQRYTLAVIPFVVYVCRSDWDTDYK